MSETKNTKAKANVDKPTSKATTDKKAESNSVSKTGNSGTGKTPISQVAAINAGSPLPGAELFRKLSDSTESKGTASGSPSTGNSSTDEVSAAAALTEAGERFTASRIKVKHPDTDTPVIPKTKKANPEIAAVAETIDKNKVNKTVVEHLYQLDLHKELAVPEFRVYTQTGEAAASILLGYEALGLVSKRWNRHKTLFTLTDEGRAALNKS
jgi:hypothetical protein